MSPRQPLSVNYGLSKLSRGTFTALPRSLTLYGYRNGRTLRAAWALAEADVAFDYVEIDLFRGGARTPEFLALNPAGKVPVLVDGEEIVTESAAICLHVAERNSGCGLVPDAASPARTQCYRWLSFVLTEMDAPLWTIAKHRFVLPPERRVEAVIDTAAWEFSSAAALLAQHLARQPYLAGGAFSVADIVAGHVLLWGRSANVLGSDATLLAYLDKLMSRPAYAVARATCSR